MREKKGRERLQEISGDKGNNFSRVGTESYIGTKSI
jgi:hypothetical protein